MPWDDKMDSEIQSAIIEPEEDFDFMHEEGLLLAQEELPVQEEDLFTQEGDLPVADAATGYLLYDNTKFKFISWNSWKRPFSSAKLVLTGRR